MDMIHGQSQSVNRYGFNRTMKHFLTVTLLLLFLGTSSSLPAEEALPDTIEGDGFTIGPVTEELFISKRDFSLPFNINDGCISDIAVNRIKFFDENISISMDIKRVDVDPCPAPSGNLNLAVDLSAAFSKFDHPNKYMALYDEAEPLFELDGFIGSVPIFPFPENEDLILPDQAVQEVPFEGSTESGVGVIRGWACHAYRVDISFDDGELINIAYGTSREDTRAICGDANNGYGMVIAWGLLGEGDHTLKTFVDGKKIDEVSFTVTGLGEAYSKGYEGTFELDDFPAPGESVIVEWSEVAQNFVVVEHIKP